MPLMFPSTYVTDVTATGEKISVLQPGKGKWEAIREIVNSKAQEEAFYVLEVDDIIRKHEEWKIAMPRVTPFYGRLLWYQTYILKGCESGRLSISFSAVKCLDDRAVLETLVSLGASFDCASKNEITKVLDLGADADRIIFAHTNKQVSHVLYAAENNVRAMTFDNEDELHKIKKHHPTAKMVLRVRCDAKEARYVLGAKFGVLPEDAPRLMELACQLEIDLVGISFHVGSGCSEPEVFERCTALGRKLFNLAAQDYGFNMTVLDLGGGYPGFDKPLFKKISSVINDSLDCYFPEGCGVNIIAEPGRYYVASAATLVVQIISRRQISIDDESSGVKSAKSYFYYINDGVYGSFRRVLDGDEVTPQPLKKHPGPEYVCTIWDPSCDALDRIPIKVKLPHMDVGDWLVFENMGAYTVASACIFNGFPITKMYPVVQLHTWLDLKDKTPFTENRFNSTNGPCCGF